MEQPGHRTHPLTLPGMESGDADRSMITLRDHVNAVVAMIDSFDPTNSQVVLIGHSGGGAIAHGAVDARPTRVERVIYVDSVPLGDGGIINDQLPSEKGQVPLPDWSFFDEEDLVDLDDALRDRFRERAIPSPVRVATDPQRLSDHRRYDVPITVISTEFPAAMLVEMIEQGDAYVAELAKIRDVDYLDLPTGHWPQFTRPQELGQAILTSLGSTT